MKLTLPAVVTEGAHHCGSYRAVAQYPCNHGVFYTKWQVHLLDGMLVNMTILQCSFCQATWELM